MNVINADAAVLVDGAAEGYLFYIDFHAPLCSIVSRVGLYTGNGHNADGEQPERYASMQAAMQKAESDAKCFTGHPDFKGGQFRVWLTREESDLLVFTTEIIA